MTKLGHPLKILGISSKAVQLACEPTPSTTATRTCTSAAVGGEATGYNSRRVLHNFGAANACSFGPQDQYGTHQHATFQPYMPSCMRCATCKHALRGYHAPNTLCLF